MACQLWAQALFGKKGTDFDFQGGRYQENKQRLEKLNTEQKKLSKNINKKACSKDRFLGWFHCDIVMRNFRASESL